MTKTIIFTLLITVLLLGCQVEQPSGLTIQLTDAAVTDAENVFLTIAGVTVKGPNGQEQFTFVDVANEPAPRQIDLLSLTGDKAVALIDDWQVPAGNYQWIRLDVVTEGSADSYVVLSNGSEPELTVPSGQLKLVRGFTVPANGNADFTVDVDLYKGLVEHNGKYSLKPVMRLINNTEAGHVRGEVSGNYLLQTVARK